MARRAAANPRRSKGSLDATRRAAPTNARLRRHRHDDVVPSLAESLTRRPRLPTSAAVLVLGRWRGARGESRRDGASPGAGSRSSPTSPSTPSSARVPRAHDRSDVWRAAPQTEIQRLATPSSPARTRDSRRDWKREDFRVHAPDGGVRGPPGRGGTKVQAMLSFDDRAGAER